MSPIKPTRHESTATDRPHEMYDQDLEGVEPTGPDEGSGRAARGSAAGSREHPPHVSDNSEGATVQGERDGGGEVPVLPANAQGTDHVSSDQSQTIDEESMYDRRPEEDKSRPPSSPRTP